MDRLGQIEESRRVKIHLQQTGIKAEIRLLDSLDLPNSSTLLLFQDKWLARRMRLESRLLDLEAERMMAEKELYRFQTLGDKYHKQYEAVVAELQQKQAEQEMIEFSARPKPITKPALGKLSKL